MTSVHILRDAQATLGEGAIWDAEAGVLWWVDIHGHAVHRTDPAGSDYSWSRPTKPGCLAPLVDGTILVARQGLVERFDPASGRGTPIAEIEAGRPSHRCNDGKPGPDGAFWIGTMGDGASATGKLYRLLPGGQPQPVLSGIAVPNALCWSPDGTELYRADSRRRMLEAHAFDAAAGAVGPPRVVLDFNETDLPADAVPDGATVDGTGRIWIAVWDGACMLAVAPDGHIERRVNVPVRRPTCPAFGGPDLRTLYVTSAALGGSGQDGALLAIEGLGVRGADVPPLHWDQAGRC